MGSLSAARALQLPVRLHGIQLGRPVDLLVDTAAWHVLGFVVLCGDESVRFLPLAASQPAEHEIAVASALMLLEDVAHYQTRGTSFRSLLGGEVERGGRPAGGLRDLLLERSGAVRELELAHGGALRRVAPDGSTVVPTRASAA